MYCPRGGYHGKKSEKKDMSCSIKCNQEYFECTDKGEHESVCNMQRAQCDCSCGK